MTDANGNEKRARAFEAQAAEARAKREESFERCDTDGFVSQFCHGLASSEALENAKIAREGGTALFMGLYEKETNRRLKTKRIETKFGDSWLLGDSEAARLGRKFLPFGSNSRIHKQLGLEERVERAPAKAKLHGSGYGFSGLASVHVITVRIGDEWGQDATTVEPIKALYKKALALGADMDHFVHDAMKANRFGPGTYESILDAIAATTKTEK